MAKKPTLSEVIAPPVNPLTQALAPKPQAPPVSQSSGGGPTISMPDTSTLAGRLAAQNITPTQIAGDFASPQQQAVANQVRSIFEGQNISRNAETDLAMQAQAAQQQAAQTQAIVSQLGAPTATPASDIRGGILPTLGNLGGALPGAVAGAATGAGAGAVGGLVGGPVAGVSVPVAAAAVGAAGLITGIYNGLRNEAQQDTQVQTTGFAASIKNINAIIYAKDHGADPIVAQQLYLNEIAKINQYESNLKALSERDWLTKAKVPLKKINQFNSGLKLKYDIKMASPPDPTAPLDISSFEVS